MSQIGLLHDHFYGAGVPLRAVELGDSIRHRAADIVGKIQVQVIHGDIDGRVYMRIHAPREISRNGDNSRHVNMVEQYLRLRGRGISNAKDISIVNNLRHLLPFYPLVQRDKRHRVAPNGNRSQRIHQHESNRSQHRDRYIDRLAQTEEEIFSDKDPDWRKYFFSSSNNYYSSLLC